MKNLLKIHVLVMVLCGVFLFAKTTRAAVVYSQPTDNSYYTASGGSSFSLTSTLPAGTPIYYTRLDIDGLGNDIYVNLGSGVGDCAHTIASTTAIGKFVEPFSCVLNSPTSVLNITALSGSIHVGISSGITVYAVYYDAQGTFGSASSTTHFIAPYTPANGSLSPTEDPTFSFTFNFIDYGRWDYAGVEIQDLSTGAVGYLATSSISSIGINSYSSSEHLFSGHLYLWRPYLGSFTGNPSLYGDYYSLDVGFRSGSSTPYTGATVGTSTVPDTTSLLSFLNVPQLLRTKIPFAYIYQIATGLSQGFGSSTASSLPTGTISYTIPGRATSSIDLFSTTTIGYFLSPSLIALFRGLQVAILYISFGYALYRIAKSKHLL